MNDYFFWFILYCSDETSWWKVNWGVNYLCPLIVMTCYEESWDKNSVYLLGFDNNLELKQRPLMIIAYWPPIHDLQSLLFMHSWTMCLGMAALPVSWTLTPKGLIKKITYRVVNREFNVNIFSNESPLTRRW